MKRMVAEAKQFYRGKLLMPQKEFLVEDSDVADLITMGLASLAHGETAPTRQPMQRRRGRYLTKEK